MNNLKTIDRETVFQFVNQKDWKSLIEVFKENENYKFISEDSILKPLIDKYFIKELLDNSSLQSDPAYKYYLQNFYQLHVHEKFQFQLKEENFKKLIVKIVETEENLNQAYHFATYFPEETICQKKIKEYEESLPKVVRHSQENELYVTENKNIGNRDATISLFKSTQEYHFYKAVREVFQMFLLIPNVSLNAIIDFDKIKSRLTKEEKDYFFTALLDCAIIDTEKKYKPIKFFELDSSFHDKEEQLKKDKMKDKIFAAAGQKLLRIRRKTFKENEKDFIKLIRETID
jgi:hypothetical protein